LFLYYYTPFQYICQIHFNKQKTAFYSGFLIYHSLFCSVHPSLSSVSDCFRTQQS